MRDIGVFAGSQKIMELSCYPGEEFIITREYTLMSYGFPSQHIIIQRRRMDGSLVLVAQLFNHGIGDKDAYIYIQRDTRLFHEPKNGQDNDFVDASKVGF